jgi:hypothetical protein
MLCGQTEHVPQLKLTFCVFVDYPPVTYNPLPNKKCTNMKSTVAARMLVFAWSAVPQHNSLPFAMYIGLLASYEGCLCLGI